MYMLILGVRDNYFTDTGARAQKSLETTRLHKASSRLRIAMFLIRNWQC
jgi:hypothetical protein